MPVYVYIIETPKNEKCNNSRVVHYERLGSCSSVRSWYAHCLALVSAIRTLAGFMDNSSAKTSSLLPSMYFPSRSILLRSSNFGHRRTSSSISSFEIIYSSICRRSSFGSDCIIYSSKENDAILSCARRKLSAVFRAAAQI